MTARGTIVATMLAGAVMIAASTSSRHTPWLIWNASASAPIGLYRIEPGLEIRVGDLAVVLPPEPLSGLLAERGYLPHGVPLLKHVLAFSGETVCRQGTAIIAHGKTYGYARGRDTRDRTLPIWKGCHVLVDGEVFLMNWDAADSFDSRYFGPLPVTAIVGRAVSLWTYDRIFPAPDTSGEPASSEP